MPRISYGRPVSPPVTVTSQPLLLPWTSLRMDSRHGDSAVKLPLPGDDPPGGEPSSPGSRRATRTPTSTTIPARPAPRRAIIRRRRPTGRPAAAGGRDAGPAALTGSSSGAAGGDAGRGVVPAANGLPAVAATGAAPSSESAASWPADTAGP